MAWNEPGGGKDPWGNGGSGNNNGGNRGGNNGGNNQGPPDLDEALKQLMAKLNGLFGGKGGGNDSNKGSGQGAGGIIGVLAIVGVLFLGFSSVYTLDEKERGVILRLGKYDRTEGPGLQFKWPLAETLTRIETTTVRKENIEERMLTEDNNIIEIELNVQYRVADPVSFALRIENPRLTLQHAAQSALRHDVGSTAMDPLLTSGREATAQQVKLRLQSYLDRYRTGIQLTNVNVKDVRPPSQVKAAFDDVQAARQDKDRLISEAESYANGIVPQARGQAQRLLEEANAYREQVVAKATGEADRFSALYTEYKKAPGVTRERLYIDAISDVYANSSKVLVDVEGGNNMMYLPLDQIMKNVSQTNAAGSTDVDVSAITDQVLNEIRSRQSDRSKGTR
jgi:membrane protease subunit HflK